MTVINVAVGARSPRVHVIVWRALRHEGGK